MSNRFQTCLSNLLTRHLLIIILMISVNDFAYARGVRPRIPETPIPKFHEPIHEPIPSFNKRPEIPEGVGEPIHKPEDLAKKLAEHGKIEPTGAKSQESQIEERFSDEVKDLRIQRTGFRIDAFEIIHGEPLNRNIKSPAFIDVLPRNETEFNNVFKKQASARDLIELNKSIKDINSLPGNEPVKSSDNNDLHQRIKDSNSDFIVIFGHSRLKGEQIVTAAGESVSARSIHATCKTANKNCLILTCNGADFSIKGNLPVSHAIKMYKNAYKNFATAKNGSEFTVGEFRKSMINTRNSKIVQERLTISALTMTTGGLVIIFNENTPFKKGSPNILKP